MKKKTTKQNQKFIARRYACHQGVCLPPYRRLGISTLYNKAKYPVCKVIAVINTKTIVLKIFISNLLYVRNPLKRRSGSTERLNLYCHKQRLMYYHLIKQQTRTFHRLVKGSGLNALVPMTGLEPVRYCYRGILSPLCLPIPPHRHMIYDILKVTICQE